MNLVAASFVSTNRIETSKVLEDKQKSQLHIQFGAIRQKAYLKSKFITSLHLERNLSWCYIRMGVLAVALRLILGIIII